MSNDSAAANKFSSYLGSKSARFGLGIAVLLAVSALGGVIFRVGWINFVDNYQIGYKFDSRSGTITILPEPGYYVTPPFVVSVHTVDMRPMQVCINANQRVLNCKLVQFKKDEAGLKLFLSWHGRSDYQGPGMSGNPTDTSNNFREILKSYAYDGSGKNYLFLDIVRELKPEEVGLPK